MSDGGTNLSLEELERRNRGRAERAAERERVSGMAHSPIVGAPKGEEQRSHEAVRLDGVELKLDAVLLQIDRLEANYAEDQALGVPAPVSEGWVHSGFDAKRVELHGDLSDAAILDSADEHATRLFNADVRPHPATPCHHDDLEWCGDCRQVECVDCGATFVPAKPAQR